MTSPIFLVGGGHFASIWLLRGHFRPPAKNIFLLYEESLYHQIIKIGDGIYGWNCAFLITWICICKFCNAKSPLSQLHKLNVWKCNLFNLFELVWLEKWIGRHYYCSEKCKKKPSHRQKKYLMSYLEVVRCTLNTIKAYLKNILKIFNLFLST